MASEAGRVGLTPTGATKIKFNTMVDFSEYRNKAGIYKWENKINHKCYIGQSKFYIQKEIHF